MRGDEQTPGFMNILVFVDTQSHTRVVIKLDFRNAFNIIILLILSCGSFGPPTTSITD